MPKEKLCFSDLHVHTNISLCALRTTTLESYMPYCKQNGIRRFGLANHMYKAETLKRRGVDVPPLEHVLSARDEIEAMKSKYGVDILLGCEVETFFGQKPTLDRGDSHPFDYVLLAPSHIFNLINEYGGVDLSTPEKVHDLIIEQFKKACLLEYDAPTGICHPLYPICCPWEQEVVDSYTHSELTECFGLAAEHGKSIEIHACLFRSGTKLDEDGLSPSYLRMLSVAKECGCRFHFGSDAHEPAVFASAHAKLELAARRIGLEESDLWSVAVGRE